MLRNVMGCYRTLHPKWNIRVVSNPISIPPASASDVVGQHNKNGRHSFWGRLHTWQFGWGFMVIRPGVPSFLLNSHSGSQRVQGKSNMASVIMEPLMEQTSTHIHPCILMQYLAWRTYGPLTFSSSPVAPVRALHTHTNNWIWSLMRGQIRLL